MAKVSEQYIEGIKEGRKLFDWWERDCFDTRALLSSNLESVTALRAKVARFHGSQYEIEFYDGEIAFYENQLKILED
jgi:hypothetical protein